jgi:ABC-type Fe3+-hydroxamate transport system substrate-binding protein
MEMQQMIECLLAGKEQMKQEMLARMDANQAKTSARIEDNNEKFEVLQGTLIS